MRSRYLKEWFKCIKCNAQKEANWIRYASILTTTIHNSSGRSYMIVLDRYLLICSVSKLSSKSWLRNFSDSCLNNGTGDDCIIMEVAARGDWGAPACPSAGKMFSHMKTPMLSIRFTSSATCGHGCRSIAELKQQKKLKPMLAQKVLWIHASWNHGKVSSD